MCRLISDVEYLIEILKDDPCNTIEHKGDGCEGCPYEPLLKKTYPDEYSVEIAGSCFEARYANRLIKKGVVVPPVDIGDKVWYIEGGYYNASYMRPKEIEVREINKKKSGKTIDWGFIANNTRYKFSSFGKTVFRTKAECEEAIAKKKKSSNKFT